MNRTPAQENAFIDGMECAWENNPPPAPSDPDLLSHYIAGKNRGEECREEYEIDQNSEF